MEMSTALNIRRYRNVLFTYLISSVSWKEVAQSHTDHFGNYFPRVTLNFKACPNPQIDSQTVTKFGMLNIYVGGHLVVKLLSAHTYTATREQLLYSDESGQ